MNVRSFFTLLVGCAVTWAALRYPPWLILPGSSRPSGSDVPALVGRVVMLLATLVLTVATIRLVGVQGQGRIQDAIVLLFMGLAGVLLVGLVGLTTFGLLAGL